MAVREKLAARVAPFLQDGEVAQEVFRARLPGATAARRPYVVIVIGTQDAVVILKASTWSTKIPKELVARVPKSAPMLLRQVGGGPYWALRIGDHVLEVGGRSTLAEATELVGPNGTLPTQR